jgi:hypothetical protein
VVRPDVSDNAGAEAKRHLVLALSHRFHGDGGADQVLVAAGKLPEAAFGAGAQRLLGFVVEAWYFAVELMCFRAKAIGRSRRPTSDPIPGLSDAV